MKSSDASEIVKDMNEEREKINRIMQDRDLTQKEKRDLSRIIRKHYMTKIEDRVLTPLPEPETESFISKIKSFFLKFS